MPDLRLDERIPEKGFATSDDMLDVFLAWVADCGLSLYPHQQDAVLELFSGNHVILDAPTGSGKSLVAEALHFKTFAETGRAWYTAPVKALVSQKFFELCGLFGAENVGMMTGDGAVNRDAHIICCTAEILANLALREGEDAKVTSVVMDEFHYYADRDRGMAWQIPLLTLPKTTFLLMSATLGDTTHIREDLVERTGRPVAEVRGAHRPVPLEYGYSMKAIHEELAELVRTGKAPIYAVHFTQQAATEQAQALMSVDWCTKDEKKVIAEAAAGVNVVTTAAFITGRRLGDDRQRLVDACERGNSSLFGTGVSPGFAELVAITIAGICGRVDKVTVAETADTTFYDSPDTERVAGFGHPIDDPGLAEMARAGTAVFGEAVAMVADALGVELDEVVCESEFAQTTADLEMASWTIPAGHVAGVAASWQGRVGDRTVVELSVRWKKGPTLDPDWVIEKDGWMIRVDGLPTVTASLDFLPPPDFQAETIEDFMAIGHIITAVPALNAIAAVVAAPPGIVTYPDLSFPMPRGWIKP